MQNFAIVGKSISVFSDFKTGYPIIYLNTFSDEGQKVFEAAQAAGCPPFTLVAISDLDWNHDMAPWDSPPGFKNAEPFTGGANDYLRLLVDGIIPRAEKELAGPPAWRGDRWILFGWPIRPVRHLPDRCVLTGGVHVWLLVVSWFQRVHLLPRAEASAGLHLLLPGRQRGQDP